jgi:hypothetical protein
MKLPTRGQSGGAKPSTTPELRDISAPEKFWKSFDSILVK